MPTRQPPSSSTTATTSTPITMPPPNAKTFILNQYTCKGVTQFNSTDYKTTGRPRCYGIEEKLTSSMELQHQFRAMLVNEARRKQYDRDNFFESFKKERGKLIAEQTGTLDDEQDRAGGGGAVAAIAEEDEVTFNLRGYGTSHYPVLEYTTSDTPPGGAQESITLQQPIVEPGVLVKEEDDGEKFFVIKFSGYEISNDVRSIDDPELQRQMQEDDGSSSQSPSRQRRRPSQDNVEFERHMVEIEIDLDKAGEKVVDIASRTVENVKKVGGIVVDELKEDFVGRVGEMGERIVRQVPTTLERCKKTAVDIFQWWQADDDED